MCISLGHTSRLERNHTEAPLFSHTNACREGRASLISFQPTGSRLNKKVATWCNEYVLRHADEVWVGDISPNGMLSSLLLSMGFYDVT